MFQPSYGMDSVGGDVSVPLPVFRPLTACQLAVAPRVAHHSRGPAGRHQPKCPLIISESQSQASCTSDSDFLFSQSVPQANDSTGHESDVAAAAVATPGELMVEQQWMYPTVYFQHPNEAMERYYGRPNGPPNGGWYVPQSHFDSMQPSPMPSRPRHASRQTQEQRRPARDSLAASKRVHGCSLCGRVFSCSSNLSRHKRIHTGVKP